MRNQRQRIDRLLYALQRAYSQPCHYVTVTGVSTDYDTGAISTSQSVTLHPQTITFRSKYAQERLASIGQLSSGVEVAERMFVFRGSSWEVNENDFIVYNGKAFEIISHDNLDGAGMSFATKSTQNATFSLSKTHRVSVYVYAT